MNVDLRFKLNQTQQNRWNRFWAECSHSHPRNHLLFGEIERATGRKPIYATGLVDGRIVCAGMFSIRPLFFGSNCSLEAVCQRGPIFDEVDYARDFLAEILPRFKALRAGRVRISPYWVYPEAQAVESLLGELGFSPYNSNGNAKTATGLVDLRASNDEILASLKSRTRQEIRRAEKLGVSIRPANSLEEAKPFYQCLNALHQQRSLIAITYREFEATFEHIFKQRRLGVLFNAFHNSAFLGGLWVVRGSTVSHHARFVVEADALRKLSNLTIGPALWWEAIKWAKAKGCTSLNVEGYKENVDKSHPKYYTYRVKRKFNPQPVEIIAEHVFVCNGGVHLIYKGYNFCRRCLNFAKGLPYQIKRRSKCP